MHTYVLSFFIFIKLFIFRPFWISPSQSIVLSVSSLFDDYAQQVRDEIFKAGFQCDIELDPGLTLNKKIRNAQLAQYNFIFVIGEQEKTSGTVNVRTRDNKVHGEFQITEVIERFKKLQRERILNSEDSF
ncbi:threonine--tRNA ligase, cytoplasmic-like [Centruroides sculpturatus]|uniref:threonine--tRNA ligase, cytoplasmic-like n=1 Tax=Centruroides sculpturatus TaxID=218467 RepID=UPI000C6DADA7|nr:threonine--tRNA ligase, cytoplasmic-like [Centruroides sculpturatus]